MSEAATQKAGTVKLTGVYALKLGMSQVYDESGEIVPVTLLKVNDWVVTQIKTQEQDGYAALQISSVPRKMKNSAKSAVGHFKKSKIESAMRYVREIRQNVPEGAQLGQKVDLESLVKGDYVKVTGKTKGRGFQGSVKRFNFAGGPAAHGSKFHRQPGSSGNRTWPGRVMPGKRFPGHYGDETVTVRNLRVVDVLLEEGVIMVKGAVPGARNGLVKLVKE